MKRLLCVLLIGFVFLAPAAAFANGKNKRGDDHHHHDDHDRDRYDDHDHHPGKHKGHHKQEYRRGVVYVERRVYVDDYPRYHLHEPPRGHRWVRSDDGKYVLIAVATGIIADVLLHH
ncbi:RcnB family protein [Lysobacter sp. S4-A87]|uniref:RcnB family protein n=1 Tax=Lysobacter sp. S4-A87 TaxID=2925843 RepID=UPI001F52D9C2|nr:RcnB family protein [Lysobacter sp. S4-A87]UNK47989.1 RcnB family protein [Lysobacter sp. S4-A87]